MWKTCLVLALVLGLARSQDAGETDPPTALAGPHPLLPAARALTAHSIAGPAATCPEGFGGAQCAVCQTDAACAGATGNAAATCSNSVQYNANSTMKSYSCDPISPDIIKGLIQPNSLLIQCRTGLGAAPAAPFAAPPTPALEPALGAAVPASAVTPGPAPVPAEGPAADAPFAALPGPAALPPVLPPALAPAAADAAAAPAGRRLLQAPAPAPEASAGTCEISFLVADPAVKVLCQATGCAIPPPGVLPDPSVTCEATTCACPDDATCGGGGESLAAACSPRRLSSSRPGCAICRRSTHAWR